MRLLILTQKVDQNDPILGFFHRWIEEFAKHCEQVTVIALGVGEYHLPDNVRIFSLGKEKKRNSLQKLFSFFVLLFTFRKEYDAVFVHMNPIYAVLGGPVWKILGKRIGLWYTHKHIDLKLRIAEKFANVIFTASPESFRLASEKVKVVGHGIDTEVFKPAEKGESKVLRITTAGRISPVKDYETLIEAVGILVSENVPALVDIIGGPATVTDENYLRSLHTLVQEKKLDGTIRFVGPVSNKELPEHLGQADIFVNMSRTGSLDKAVLEAMACGIPAVTSNEALRAVLGVDAPALMFTAGNARECADRIKGVGALSVTDLGALSKRLRAIVEKEHNIEVLIPRTLSFYEATS